MAKSLVLSSLKGLSAAVTGGSSGLGLATVERLSKQGCTVAVLDLQEPEKLTANNYFIKTDITNEQNVMSAVDAIEKKAKKLDILVNCAGIFYPKEIFNMKTHTPHPLNDYERIMKINTTGTFNTIRFCCGLFNKNEPNDNQQRGVIINVASALAFEAPAGYFAYGASKGAIVGMTLPLARDLAKMGVRVMTIAPGVFGTPLIAPAESEFQSRLLTLIPFPQRYGRPDEFAHLVQAIIENPMLNGEVIRLDAAFRMSI